MRKIILLAAIAAVLLLALTLTRCGRKKPADTIKTDAGKVTVTFLGHASLMFQWNGKVIDIDPCSDQADYSKLPKADLVLVTHEHEDHLDPAAVAAVSKPGTVVAASALAAAKLPGAVSLRNGDSRKFLGQLLRVDSVPAYNIAHMRAPGRPYHPKGAGNGYVLHFGTTRFYVAGDTEDIPEMSALADVDVAFLPVNLPYTMDIDMLDHAANMLRPKILYPYHTTDTDMRAVASRLRDVPGVQTRIRPMK